MNKKKTITILISIMFCLVLSGCNLIPSLDLTEEEQKVIAEYSAGLLLKYDRNYNGSLKKLNEEEEEEEGLPVVEENAPVMQPEVSTPDMPEPEFSEDMTAPSMPTMDDSEYSNVSIADAIGLSDFEIFYKSHEAHYIYPEEESSDLVFSLQAQNGMELLVLNFTITNDSDSSRVCDILDLDPSFRLIINGNERVNANKTILLNDLASYSEEIDGYGMVNAVLVFEVAEGTTAGISDMDLVVKTANGSTVHKLR